MFSNKKFLIITLLFGSIWGCLEVLLNDSLSIINISRLEIFLAAAGILVLAAARIIYNKPGSSLLIGIIAALYKVFAVAFFPCQMLAVIIEAAAFDLIYSYADKRVEERNPLRGFIGSISAYLGFAAFALSITYMVRNSYWVAGGIPRIIDYIFISGSYAALASFPAVLVGAWMGRWLRQKLLPLEEARPLIYYSGTIALAVLCWLTWIIL